MAAQEAVCPWCGETLWHPFGGYKATARSYDISLEAHVEECEPYQAENGE